MEQLIKWALKDGQMEGTVGDVPLFWIGQTATPAELEAGIKFFLMTSIPWGPKFDEGHGEWPDACKAAEAVLRDRMKLIGFAPALPELDDDALRDLVVQFQQSVLRQASADYRTYGRRIQDALAYMEHVISPSQITLDHVARVLKGE